jgi:hypothetical protein
MERDIEGAGGTERSHRKCAVVPMTQIKTRHLRRLRSPQLGEVVIEHTYFDRPASIETWIDHCGALALEFGISPVDVHTSLFAQLPEIVGR